MSSHDHAPAHVVKSHICVLLFDARSGPGEDPLAIWTRLKVFINTYLSKNRRHFVSLILYGTENVQVVYPPTQFEQRERAAKEASGATAEKPPPYVPWESLSWPVRLKEINTQMALYPQHFPPAQAGQTVGTITAAISTGLSIANKFLNGQKEIGVRSSARMLLVHRNSRYHAKEYLAMMNCIFCAEKLHIPIDACALQYDKTGDNKLETLTQAASITRGLYFELDSSRHNAFLQWLFTIFFAHTERRDLVS